MILFVKLYAFLEKWVDFMHSKERVALAVMMVCALSVEGSAEDSYEVPLTEHGQPDFQGSWGIRFSTPLERYDGMPLVLTAEFAKKFLDASHDAVFAGNTDPDIDIFGPQQLVTVKGEFRSSVLVYPENGKLPFNQRGIENSSFNYFIGEGYEGPERRPGVERCIEGWGAPPMRGFPLSNLPWLCANSRQDSNCWRGKLPSASYSHGWGKDRMRFGLLKGTRLVIGKANHWLSKQLITMTQSPTEQLLADLC